MPHHPMTIIKLTLPELKPGDQILSLSDKIALRMRHGCKIQHTPNTALDPLVQVGDALRQTHSAI